MTTKPRIIAEDVLLPTHFLSATEQEGVYLGQPEPDDDNSGYLKPISVGPNFDSMSLDATVASGGQDTIFKATGFNIYGDDYFINCKMRALKQFVDSGDTGHNVIGEGAISVTDVKRFGSHGIYFDGVNDYATVADHANWSTLQPDYTISLFVKHTDHVGTETYIAHYEDANNYWRFYHLHGYGMKFQIYRGGVAIVDGTYGGEIEDSNKHHLLMAKKGNIYGIYKDGLQISYHNDASMATFTGSLYIGQLGSANDYFTGHMDDVVIYQGNLFNASPNGDLTDTIAVPTTPHIPDSNTKLYLKGNVAERTITDFEQDGGKITVESAFSANLATLEAFQITKDKDDLDFRIELTSGGDVGDAKFKWSHDGGINYLGRNVPFQKFWLAEKITGTNQWGSTWVVGTQDIDGDIIIVYQTSTPAQRARVMRSTDKGVSWTEVGEFSSAIYGSANCLITLKSGRLLLGTGINIMYSDDNGETWNRLSTQLVGDLFELTSGQIICVYMDTYVVYCKISSDGGNTWGSAITIASDANYQYTPMVCQAENGDIICAYVSDQDAVNDYEIKRKISSDGGNTWGSVASVITVIGPAGDDRTMPSLLKDIDGTLYCSAINGSTKGTIFLSKSINNGDTWTSSTYITLYSSSGATIQSSNLIMIDNHKIFCAFADIHNDLAKFVSRGMWEKSATLATNACPVAIQSIEQNLIADAKTKWSGSSGIEEDKWTFGPEYYFAKENLLLDSPSLPWRSEEDDTETSIVIDLEENKGHPFDSVGLFGCNVRTLRIQASPVNETKGWILPPVDMEVSFDITTSGVIDSVVNNRIEDAALLAGYSDHELRNHYMQMTSGVANGITYKIVDNVGDRFEILSDGGIKAAVGDTFAIYKTDISCFFTDPDTTEWADLGSLEISGSNNLVEEQDIVGNLYLSGSAATNNLTRLIIGGDATLSTDSHDNCITGIQCAGTITDHGTDNIIEAGDWFNYPYRFIRILIETQNTYEGYYQIGNMVLGEYTQLSRNWRVGYNINSNFGIEMIRTPHGGLSAIRKHDEIKTFNLSWHEIDNTNIELQKLIDYIGGRNVCLIPDGDIPADCYLTKFTGVVKQRHTLLNRFDTSLIMEEVK